MEEILRVRKATKIYKNKKALDEVDIDLSEGEILGIIGESGSGKTTLAKCIVGMERVTSGKISYKGDDVYKRIKKDKLNFYKDIQMIFQNPYEVFDTRMKIIDLLEETAKLHKIGRDQGERFEIYENLFKKASLLPTEDYFKRYPGELSGGQLQRIAIIRSMLLNPKILIADEPITMLDISVRADIINLLLDLKKEKGLSIIFISHDLATTGFISDKLAVIYLGQIVEEGRTEDIIENPSHPYTKALLDSSIAFEKEKVVYKGESLLNKKDSLENKGCKFKDRCPLVMDYCYNNEPDLREFENKRVRCFRYR
ncbi:MAG: ABC transporter ATP-binding protein [Finegoldia sp.]|nr:ABC transporter ATP-binding protein [Finegoldia sp.]